MVAFLKKLQFWKTVKKTEYRFQQSPYDDATWVEITSGEYSGVVHSYGQVKFSEEYGMPKLSFGYTIISSGKYDVEALQSDQNFVTLIGDILTEIIIENEPSRTNNPTQSDL